MLKRINWRAVLITIVWALSLSGLITLMSFIEVKKAESSCKKINVILPGNQFFVERSEVDAILNENGGLLVGRRLDGINIQDLENKLKANPFIEYAKVYLDMDGVLHADVRQRVPILRIFNLSGQDFYIDQNGLKVPLSDHFTPRVLVANGEIVESFDGKVDTLKNQMGKDLFHMAQFIDKDPLWANQIVQLYVDDKNDIELVPRVGNQRIIFGDVDGMETKFRNLKLFYKKAIPKVGWDAYSIINLKFDGQIVCVKRDSTLKNNMAKPSPSEQDSLAKKLNTIQDSTKKVL
ncbi:MAG: cell division protein FtsQ [Sphingobacteriales bacterium]|nr:cell division protein FtsQ [Sphingobacteriales bacterium]